MATTFGTWADHLALTPSSGDVHRFNDSCWNEAYFDGTNWRYLVNGKELKPPTSSTFTWVNQTSGGQSASVSHSNGGEYMSTPALSGDHWRLRKEAAPTPPYKLRATILMTLPGANFALCGPLWRQSSDGKFVAAIVVHINGAVWPHIVKANSPTSIASNYAVNLQFGAMASNQLFHWELEDNNTNRIIRGSTDGITFNQVHSVARGDFMTGNEIGWCMNSNSGFPVGARNIRWEKL